MTDDEDLVFDFWEATQGDPGHLGEDEPEIQPLCRECVRELPRPGSSLCEFCAVVAHVE